MLQGGPQLQIVIQGGFTCGISRAVAADAAAAASDMAAAVSDRHPPASASADSSSGSFEVMTYKDQKEEFY